MTDDDGTRDSMGVGPERKQIKEESVQDSDSPIFNLNKGSTGPR